jgi:hypothetical protein
LGLRKAGRATDHDKGGTSRFVGTISVLPNKALLQAALKRTAEVTEAVSFARNRGTTRQWNAPINKDADEDEVALIR